jgi:hypothetical protein
MSTTNDEHLDWKPRTSNGQRLSQSPTDWSAFSVGDQIGVFLGNCWRKGVIRDLLPDCAMVKAKPLGSQTATLMRVYDARNICPARDLSRPERDTSTPLLAQEGLNG